MLLSDGNFRLSMAENDMKEGSVKSEKGEFNFKISEDSTDTEMRTVKCEITARDNHESKATVGYKSKPAGGYALITTEVLSDAILVRDVHFAVALPGLAGCSSLMCYFGIIPLVMMALFHIFV